MKRKHYGVVAVVCGLVALVVVGAYAGSGLWRSNEVIRPHRQSKALNIKMPTEQQMRQMEGLYVRLDKLAEPSVRQAAVKTLTLFGHHDNSESGQGTGEEDDTGHGKWKLSLTVRSGLNSYCVINGKFLAEGAEMADDSQVIRIENHRVLISTQQEQRWLYLNDALSPSVGGVQQAIAKKGEGQT